jgi:hypothetical protein
MESMLAGPSALQDIDRIEEKGEDLVSKTKTERLTKFFFNEFSH